jgi:hypothetical protein
MRARVDHADEATRQNEIQAAQLPRDERADCSIDTLARAMIRFRRVRSTFDHCTMWAPYLTIT